jgi:hypothetical protein
MHVESDNVCCGSKFAAASTATFELASQLFAA